MVRKELSPLEEARAVRAMLDEGYTVDGTASVLGWSRNLVSARVKILELPDSAQQLIGSREIPVRAVDALLRIAAVAPSLVDALAQTVNDGKLDGAQLVHDLGWALGQAMRHTSTTAFAAYLNQVHPSAIEELRLGKKAAAAMEEAEELHKQLERYAYGPPTVRFAEADADQARAAGVLIELERAAPIICDRALYRELCKAAIARTVEELRERKASAAGRQAEVRASKGQRERTPREELDVEHRGTMRDLAARAAAVNLDLGASLLTELSVVDPTDVNVARFLAYSVLGPDRSNHFGVGDNTARVIAENGLRLVLDELRSTETPTLKSGKPGKTKVTYAPVDDAQAWLWRFLDGAKSAGEIYGRAMVVLAAQHYAHQIALPASQRRSSVLPGSRKDTARKAFERVTKQALPGTYTQLTRAIDREANRYHRRQRELDEHGATAATTDQPDVDAAGQDDIDASADDKHGGE